MHAVDNWGTESCQKDEQCNRYNELKIKHNQKKLLRNSGNPTECMY